MAKKTQLETLKNQKNMTIIAPTEEIILAQNLELRNQDVEKAYHNIIKGCRELLTAFEQLRYRMNIHIDHINSDKETNLIHEWICHFWDITLTRNRFGYNMVYVAFDEDALTRFGDKLFNKMLRVVFKHTNPEVSELNIENCIRIEHSASDIQPFFISRLLNGEKDFVSITSEERVPS